MSEDQKDRRLAIIVLLTALSLGFFLGFMVRPVLACDSYKSCDSYEDCLRLARANEGNNVFEDNNYRRASANQYLLEAVLYKLDDISKELKPKDTSSELSAKIFYIEKGMKLGGGPTTAPAPGYDIEKCADGCLRWFDPVSKSFWKDGAYGTAIACDDTMDKILNKK